jgi:hypothetical protein
MGLKILTEVGTQTDLEVILSASQDHLCDLASGILA